MVKYEETVLEAAAKKANPNVYLEARHMHWAKKAEPQQQVENVDRIPMLIAKALLKTLKLSKF
jgi:hypothetical protein